LDVVPDSEKPSELSGLDSGAHAAPMTASVSGKNQSRGGAWHRAFLQINSRPAVSETDRWCPLLTEGPCPRCAPRISSVPGPDCVLMEQKASGGPGSWAPCCLRCAEEGVAQGSVGSGRNEASCAARRFFYDTWRNESGISEGGQWLIPFRRRWARSS
jgi:hypothetical protein